MLYERRHARSSCPLTVARQALNSEYVCRFVFRNGTKEFNAFINFLQTSGIVLHITSFDTLKVENEP